MVTGFFNPFSTKTALFKHLSKIDSNSGNLRFWEELRVEQGRTKTERQYTDSSPTIKLNEVYCYERKRNQLGFDSRYYYQRPTLSNLPHQQINGFVSASQRKDTVRIHGQENSLLQNQKG